MTQVVFLFNALILLLKKGKYVMLCLWQPVTWYGNQPCAFSGPAIKIACCYSFLASLCKEPTVTIGCLAADS